MRYLYFVIIFFSATIAFAQPQLLKDINVETPAISGSITRYQVVKFKDRLYFPAYGDGVGEEIFSTDGTAEGTNILKNVYPGEKGIGSGIYMAALDDYLLFGFTAEDGGFLYSSDGTTEETKKIAAVQTFSEDEYFTVVNNVAYFSGYDDAHGWELWRSDGTEEGTYMVKDINPGPASATQNAFAAGDDEVFFSADDGATGRKNWVSDGTPEGTTVLNNLGGDLFTATLVGNTIYVIAGAQIVKSDGTEAGTSTITSFGAGHSGFREKPVLIGDKLIFRHAYQGGATDYGTEWWVLNTTNESYSILKDITPNLYDSFGSVSDSGPVVFNNEVWFLAQYDQYNYGIYKTDGTTANTIRVFDSIVPQFTYGMSLIPADDKLYFSYGTGTTLKVTDGVSALATVEGSGYMYAYVPFNGKLFIVRNGEPWISDGTAAGTKLIKSLNPLQSYLGFYNFIKINDRVVFMNTTPDNYRRDLWGTDGTTSETGIVHTFIGGAMSGEVTTFNQKLYFLGHDKDDPSYSNIWTTDGTFTGTQPLKTGDWFSSIWNEAHFQQLDNTLYIFFSTELWKTDGTSSGTAKVTSFPLGQSYQKSNHVVFKGSLYYFLWGKLWKSDGTAEGAAQIIDIGTPSDSQYTVQGFYASSNAMYFIAETDANGWEVWTTDGTAVGTHLVKDIHLNDNTKRDVRPVFVGLISDVMLFRYAEAKDMELWRTDGTEEGTFVVKDIYPGSTPSNPGAIAQLANTIYFVADDGVHGYELWKTDGTEDGTVMVKDIYPGKMWSESPVAPAATFVNGFLYFPADDGVHGFELWKTDGTEAGTSFVYDLNPGIVGGVTSTSMTSIGDELIFIGFEPIHSREIWTYDLSPKLLQIQIVTFDPIPSKTVHDAPFTLTATASSGLPVTFEVISGPATISGNTLTITGAGDVTVKAMQDGNDDYLAASTEQTFTVQITLGLEEQTNLTIYPNPATTTLIVRAQAILLTDMLGHTVITKESSQGETTIDVGHLPRGMYIARMKGSNQSSVTQKIILR